MEAAGLPCSAWRFMVGVGRSWVVSAAQPPLVCPEAVVC